MKNAILVFLLISCSWELGGDFAFNNPEFSSMKEACKWIYNNIEYKKEDGDDWKMPDETLDDGEGDCEDMAILLMAIWKYQTGKETELIGVKTDSGRFHAVVRHEGKYYDCTSGKKKDNYDNIIATYSYNQTMQIAKYLKN
jgi:hypothetical protein